MGWSKKELKEELEKVQIERNRYKDRAFEAEQDCRNIGEEIVRLKKEIQELRCIAVDKSKELELMYLRAIGAAKTTKEVRDIQDRYYEHGGILTRLPGHKTLVGSSVVDIPARWQNVADFDFYNAIKTKTKRLNQAKISNVLADLEDVKDGRTYAAVMMALVKDITGRNIDGVKVFEAKKSGLSPRGVFLSILAQEDIPQDSVM